jgi:hypothetical protein
MRTASRLLEPEKTSQRPSPQLEFAGEAGANAAWLELALTGHDILVFTHSPQPAQAGDY